MKYLLRIVFYVFSAVTAGFWNKTVVYLRAVPKARFQARGRKGNTSGRKTEAGASGVLYVFFNRIKLIINN